MRRGRDGRVSESDWRRRIFCGPCGAGRQRRRSKVRSSIGVNSSDVVSRVVAMRIAVDALDGIHDIAIKDVTVNLSRSTGVDSSVDGVTIGGEFDISEPLPVSSFELRMTIDETIILACRMLKAAGVNLPPNLEQCR